MVRNTAAPSKAATPTAKKEKRKGAGGSRRGRFARLALWAAAGVPLLALWIAWRGLGGKMTSPVVELKTDAAFKKFLASHPNGSIVNFYLPGCEHCRNLKPEYEAAAEAITRKAGGLAFASVDGEMLVAVAKQYGVDRYPTMFIFRNGENVLELGPTVRTKEKLVEYVEWASQPAVIEFSTTAEFDDALPTLRHTLSSKLPAMVVAYAGPTAPGLRPAVEAAAERLRGKTVFILVGEGASDDGVALRAYAHDASGDEEYSGPIERDAVLAWATGIAKRRRSNTSDSVLPL